MKIKDPYVVEVLRLIKDHPLCCVNFRSIVLVSFKFFRAAQKQVDIVNEEIWGYMRQGNDSLLVHNCLVALPVMWLGPYEFEIRPIPSKGGSMTEYKEAKFDKEMQEAIKEFNEIWSYVRQRRKQ